jgi:alanyl-tRNA synthetase
MAYDDALAQGATALFGEKYGDVVRVITFDPSFSRELCGGTHVDNTSRLGVFKITSESSVASGVRRIEAVTALEAFNLLHKLQHERDEIAGLLNHPKNLKDSIQKLQEDLQKLQESFQKIQLEKVSGLFEELKKKAESQDGMNRIIAKVELPDAESAKDLCFRLKQAIPRLYCVLAFEVESKPGIAVMISDELVSEKGLDAAAIVRELGKEIQGGGGGQKFFATAGGKNLAGLDKVIELAKNASAAM